MTERVQPSEQDVIEACSALLADAPNLGIQKILGRLHTEKDWSISEKRLKGILSTSGLRSPSTKGSKYTATTAVDTPVSHLDTSLPIPSSVRAVYFDGVKGKGLVADRDFAEAEVIFTEDAFIAAPPAHALAAVESGQLCTHCFAPINGQLVALCGRTGCPAKFCNRLCQSRAQSAHHALLCPAQNTSIKVRSVVERGFDCCGD